ncbi:hypothetical protein FZ103_07825 [Streptomonospora sp. PA3]|uniref:hypothetical protein n=1 Tax=Streptomonospora sp. PA3 TaxID=2607326 RepID=UPI0012DFDD23|nr:hypothetical protein [Streptomonospora sp. PA3]MUL41090.1 hypothetical protein [Streptomonospora sp. PA3]
MSLTSMAGLAGIGFVVAAIAVNIVYVRARLPLPGTAASLEAAAGAYAGIGEALKKPSVAAPLSWVCTTVFAAGLLSVLWRGGSGAGAWALVGFAGVLMQNATFTVVEALRFGMASAAAESRGALAGLWGLSNVLFGFNQVFLAIALLGFTAAGAGSGLIPGWHAALGYASAALLFLSSSASPFNADGTDRTALVGLVGWLGWAAWIVAYSIVLLGL